MSDIPEGPESKDEPQEYILTQEQIDAVERMTVLYALMMTERVITVMSMPHGELRHQQTHVLAEIEEAMLEVTRILFPERHAAAIAAKQRVLGNMGFN